MASSQPQSFDSIKRLSHLHHCDKSATNLPDATSDLPPAKIRFGVYLSPCCMIPYTYPWIRASCSQNGTFPNAVSHLIMVWKTSTLMRTLAFFPSFIICDLCSKSCIAIKNIDSFICRSFDITDNEKGVSCCIMFCRARLPHIKYVIFTCSIGNLASPYPPPNVIKPPSKQFERGIWQKRWTICRLACSSNNVQNPLQ